MDVLEEVAMAIRVVVTGACGKMGQEVVRSISRESDIELVGAVDMGSHVGTDIGQLSGIEEIGVAVSHDLSAVLEHERPDCLVDFTKGHVAPENILRALSHHVAAVVGTTGISDDALKAIRKKSEETETPVLIAPNFSLGAVLLMKFATIASQYFKHAEIIELHHDKKADAPSGTAIRTADLMTGNDRQFISPDTTDEKIAHVRGGVHKSVHIHSVRLPGLLAHQEVLFGGEGEFLTIRHDSTARSCFMPGLMLAIRKIGTRQGLMIGLENLME